MNLLSRRIGTLSFKLTLNLIFLFGIKKLYKFDTHYFISFVCESHYFCQYLEFFKFWVVSSLSNSFVERFFHHITRLCTKFGK